MRGVYSVLNDLSLVPHDARCLAAAFYIYNNNKNHYDNIFVFYHNKSIDFVSYCEVYGSNTLNRSAGSHDSRVAKGRPQLPARRKELCACTHASEMCLR